MKAQKPVKNDDRRRVTNKALRVVKLAEIKYDLSYQRGVLRRGRTMREMDPDAFGVPTLGEREDGSLWCVDGRQRIQWLMDRGELTVRADVFASRGPEHEAEVFSTINRGRRPLKPMEVFNADLTRKDPVAWKIKEIVKESGLQIPATQSSGRDTAEIATDTVSCVNTLRMCIESPDGEERLRFVLRTIKACWDGDPDRTRNEMVGGLSHFYGAMGGKIDEARLRVNLETTRPKRLMNAADYTVGNRYYAVMRVIEECYRKRAKGFKRNVDLGTST